MGLDAFDFILLKGPCTFFRDSGNPGVSKARCRLGSVTMCTGDVKFCGNMEALRNYVVSKGLGWQKDK